MANPQTDHKSDWIIRAQVIPFELTLKGEKQKVEVIDFFVNANLGIKFFLKNALQNEDSFEMCWKEELERKEIGFSEINPNTLVVNAVSLYFENEPEATDLEINWENIVALPEGGLVFSLTSPASIPLKQHNFTYDKVFWFPEISTKHYDWVKKRLAEWKSNKKPFVLRKQTVSFDNWLSTKESKNLYVTGREGKGRSTELSSELSKEIEFLEEISDWLKLPYSQREKFIKRYWEGDESVESMKKEIEKTIQELGNKNLPKKQNNSTDNNKRAMNKGLKVSLWAGGLLLGLLITILVIFIIIKSQGEAKKENRAVN